LLLYDLCLFLQAEEFRNFWKEKSDLRRFPDGSIREAVVWPSDTLADCRMICSRIVKHILSRLAVCSLSLNLILMICLICLHLV